MSDDVVRAAGGVPWRRRNGHVEVLLIHRPKYDDWSFPKGKNLAGERDEDCAVREVAEETSLQVHLGRDLGTVSYEAKGKPKRVHYWAVLPTNSEDARPANEIDEVTWLDSDEAATRLTYDRDRDVLRSFVEGA